MIPFLLIIFCFSEYNATSTAILHVESYYFLFPHFRGLGWFFRHAYIQPIGLRTASIISAAT